VGPLGTPIIRRASANGSKNHVGHVAQKSKGERPTYLKNNL